MTDTLTRTACGLYVMPDGDPRGWPNFTWTQEVTDPDGDNGDQENYDALALIGVDLMAQAGRGVAAGGYVTPADVAFACLHLEPRDRVPHSGLDFADPEVLGDTIDGDTFRQQATWTVCGLLEGSWRTVCYEATAGAPVVAYYRAWEWCQEQHGGYLLLAAVHPGPAGPVARFDYADPWARTAEDMAVKAAKWAAGIS